ncbi:hypothetical protein AB8E26_02315 [Stenotrophomonas rhizophila]|jgi:hypothetical protein|uniref:hypothetical protein n=1 Tax=Stenotrophomonas rhizophila TaxID=216778 RepID=UPI003515940D
MPIHLHLTRTTLRGRQVLAVLESSAPASTAPVPDVATAAQCAVGSYRMADGSSVDIGPEAMAEQLPWRLPDGRTGQRLARGHHRWVGTRVAKAMEVAAATAAAGGLLRRGTDRNVAALNAAVTTPAAPASPEWSARPPARR